MMSNDVINGFLSILPRYKILFIEIIVIALMNVAQKNTINEFGEIVDKKCLTHNQSYEGPSGASINNRLRTEELQETRLGRLPSSETMIVFFL